MEALAAAAVARATTISGGIAMVPELEVAEAVELLPVLGEGMGGSNGGGRVAGGAAAAGSGHVGSGRGSANESGGDGDLGVHLCLSGCC